MNQISASLPREASEFDFSGLTPLESPLISAPRVAESSVSFECRCTQIIQLAAADGHKVWLVLREVVMVHVAQSLLQNGVYNTAAAGHVLRGRGGSDYFTIGPDQLSRMIRPK
jgi:flavin reductase (DIM6/NTAB) family NADH-FMN oxidoreductase RutF